LVAEGREAFEAHILNEEDVTSVGLCLAILLCEVLLCGGHVEITQIWTTKGTAAHVGAGQVDFCDDGAVRGAVSDNTPASPLSDPEVACKGRIWERRGRR
jgi:hypothetical protein